jgi:hypothetical protein
MQDSEMGGACSMYEGSRRTLYKFLVGKPEGKGHLEDLGIHGRVLCKYIFVHFILSFALKCFNL